ncbi:helix-turn-helix domain-containing protein [Actinomadura gamaensis]|uniref:Helix-turn-helix domain-containing protein n=1 Tax=Actinomadura gamaensis TaxID=1763541 RepID=A0ABV9U9H2_9ACTN
MLEGMGSGPDRERVAKYVVARRGALGLTQEALAERAGVTVKTVYNLEAGGRWPQARTRAAIEAALLWRSGDLALVGDGGEPEEAERNEPRGDQAVRELAELDAYFADLRAGDADKRRMAIAFLRALYGEPDGR